MLHAYPTLTPAATLPVPVLFPSWCFTSSGLTHFDILLEKWELQDRWVLAILQIGNRVTSPVHVGAENLILRAGPTSPALSLLQLLKFLWAASNRIFKLTFPVFFPRWSFTAHSLVLSKPSHVGNGWMKMKEMVS